MRVFTCLFALLGACALSWGAPAPPADSSTTSAVPRLAIDDSPTTNPWTSLEMNNDPRNFQFALVTDRSGGVRPGVFEDAVTKINLLQPEFVMSVGDLIAGYSKDRGEIERQWDEFEGFTSRLKMPFFYVPGNHDMATPVQKDIWKERFGRDYYHFVYGDVLFLCVNSEDPSAAMSREQVEYFRRALDENKDVRWTLAFLHRPLWVGTKEISGDDGESESYEGSGWSSFERLLIGRRHTVFAGHLHRYHKHVRNKENYIVLATTGGGSPLRGARPYGEFDQVAWITMTDDGPVMANIELDGIWDENVVTSELARLVHPLLRQGVQTRAVVTDPAPFGETTASVRLTNDADLPLRMTLKFKPHDAVRVRPAEATRTVPPNSVEFFEVTLRNSAAGADRFGEPLRLTWRGEYDPPGQEKVAVDGASDMIVDPKRVVAARKSPVEVDGKLDEWPALPVVVNQPAAVTGKKGAWRGPQDCKFRFGVERDEQFVYVAVNVTDDMFVLAEDGAAFGDGVVLEFDPRGRTDEEAAPARALSKKEIRRESRRSTGTQQTMRVMVSADAAADTQTTGGAAQAVRYAGARTAGGFTAEAAFPVAAVEEAQGADWDSFRLNVTVYDRDRRGEAGGEDRAGLWWRPEWTSPAAYPGAGTFVRR